MQGRRRKGSEGFVKDGAATQCSLIKGNFIMKRKGDADMLSR